MARVSIADDDLLDPLAEIVPLIGSKEGISHVALAYLEPGRIAIIPEPGYNAYQGGAMLASGQPYRYALRPRTNFLLELGDIPYETLHQARVLYLNYPNNPTAAIAPAADLVAWTRLDPEIPHSIFEIEGAREVAIEFHSLSKTYNMTGWRCAWSVASPEISAILTKVKSFTDTGAFMAVQAAGVAALESYDSFVPRNVATFKARRDAAVEAFSAAGFSCESPRATMYLWIPLPDGVPSAMFAERLLEDEGVVVMPGSGFGAGGEGFFRISFIVSPERIAEAARRAGRVLASLGAEVA